MSNNNNSFWDDEARALEREAHAAKADMEQLVAAVSALPAELRATIRARIEPERTRLEAIAARAERALDDQRVEFAAELALLEAQLQEHDDQLERSRIEASKAQAEAAYQARRPRLENARAYARDGIDLSIETNSRYRLAFDPENQ